MKPQTHQRLVELVALVAVVVLLTAAGWIGYLVGSQ